MGKDLSVRFCKCGTCTGPVKCSSERQYLPFRNTSIPSDFYETYLDLERAFHEISRQTREVFEDRIRTEQLVDEAKTHLINCYAKVEEIHKRGRLDSDLSLNAAVAACDLARDHVEKLSSDLAEITETYQTLMDDLSAWIDLTKECVGKSRFYVDNS